MTAKTKRPSERIGNAGVEWCLVHSPSGCYLCTRELDHEGQHVGHVSDGRPAAAWKDDDTTEEEW